MTAGLAGKNFDDWEGVPAALTVTPDVQYRESSELGRLNRR